ncbi:MAG TPA: hypothetical protein VF411_12660 [Bacteroidia bacterium]
MKTKNILAGLLIILSLLTACKKYPDGPWISLESRAARVANVWKMEQVTLNGLDVTSTYKNINYIETYDKIGNYSYSSTVGSGSGKWAFENRDTQIKRSGVSGQPSEDLTILRLEEKSFWYKFIDGKDSYEFHLMPN